MDGKATRQFWMLVNVERTVAKMEGDMSLDILYDQGLLQIVYTLDHIILCYEVHLTGLYFYSVTHCRPGSRDKQVSLSVIMNYT
jgi:hypothetical protein